MGGSVVSKDPRSRKLCVPISQLLALIRGLFRSLLNFPKVRWQLYCWSAQLLLLHPHPSWVMWRIVIWLLSLTASVPNILLGKILLGKCLYLMFKMSAWCLDEHLIATVAHKIKLRLTDAKDGCGCGNLSRVKVIFETWRRITIPSHWV